MCIIICICCIFLNSPTGMPVLCFTYCLCKNMVYLAVNQHINRFYMLGYNLTMCLDIVINAAWVYHLWLYSIILNRRGARKSSLLILPILLFILCSRCWPLTPVKLWSLQIWLDWSESWLKVTLSHILMFSWNYSAIMEFLSSYVQCNHV